MGGWGEYLATSPRRWLTNGGRRWRNSSSARCRLRRPTSHPRHRRQATASHASQCSPEGQNDNGMMYWPRWPILLTFYQWYEYTGNYTYIQASLDWLQEAAVRMQTQPMGYDWSGVRTQDWIYVLEYLLEDDSPVPAAEKAFLWNFTGIVLNNGRKVFDWERTWWVTMP